MYFYLFVFQISQDNLSVGPEPQSPGVLSCFKVIVCFLFTLLSSFLTDILTNADMSISGFAYLHIFLSKPLKLWSA